MSRFNDEFSIISRTGKLIAFLVWLVLTGGLYTLFATVGKPGDPPFWFRAYLCLIVPIPLSIFALVVAYINADAKRRGMRYVMWKAVDPGPERHWDHSLLHLPRAAAGALRQVRRDGETDLRLLPELR